MKKLLALLLAMMTAALTGCSFISFNVDELLSAPVITDEQKAIYSALIARSGRSISLEYPQTGENRSAFILENIDGDSDEEALAFYSYSDDDDVRMCILDRDAEGNWVAVFEVEGHGNSVDRVYINNVNGIIDINVGYGNYGYGESTLAIYRYVGDRVVPFYQGNYSVLEIQDMNGDGLVEIIMVSKLGSYTEVTVINNTDGINYDTSKAKLSGFVASIAGHSIGKLDDTHNILYLDVMDETGYIYTEILYMNDEGLLCPSSSIPGMRNATKRQYGYLSFDYDGDGYVEVPLNEAFMGYNANSWSDSGYMTVWMDYDPERFAFDREASSYYDIAQRFVFKLPNRWLGVVSIIKNEETGEITFVKYDPGVESLEDMTPIMSFVSVGPDESIGDYYTMGYELVTSTDFRSYMVKIIADDSEPLVLTNDEIKNNFYAVS